MSVDGILNVLKPAGKTSFAVVSFVRRWSGERRVGHAGTLDPDASGVLVVCLGQATRIVEYLADAEKAYRAEIELGVTTDTYDAAGRVSSTCDPSSVTEDEVRRVLESFRGQVRQIPPMHSAVHYKGRRLYELARKGIEVDREPRQVEISRLQLLAWEPPLVTVELDCSGGTYVRSLAHDIGVALGCGAHLRRLVRLRSGSFRIDAAVPLEALEESFRRGDWQSHLHPMDEVLVGWPAAVLDVEREALVRRGVDVELQFAEEGDQVAGRCRAYGSDGHFLAVLVKTEGGLWHPEKVFRARCSEARRLPPP
ncbi:MAG: tRNA pseudouridine(55) synthase TruB [Dehalococcoidia bacterium]|nr:tRNA pseudouridine(55) synthase TruB [Dehalococcoidia bacterium]